MSDVLENLKDAINPHRRENATAPTYDASKRGAYADAPAKSEPELALPADSKTQDSSKMIAPDSSTKAATNANFNAPERTYGPHDSKIANALDPRVDSDRDGRPKHGGSALGRAAKRET
ncbi:hypothetical protein OQA88_2464 [Cercophora sp. LCS_1]